MSQPIPFTVTRYKCPHCTRTRSSKRVIVEHIGRCWENPEARSCKTCVHHAPATHVDTDYGPVALDNEFCRRGVQLDDGLPINCPKWEA